MADGATKPISEIKIGDEVLAKDPLTGEARGAQVTAVMPHEDFLLDLVLEDGSRVTTTEDHPFWNHSDKEWQQSQDLQAGDLVLTSEGQVLPVEGLDWTSVSFGAAYKMPHRRTLTFESQLKRER